MPPGMVAQQQQQQQQSQQHQHQAGMVPPQALAQTYAQQLQNMSMSNGQMRHMSPQMAQMQQQMARMSQMSGNPMQRQVSGQMMNGTSPNMQHFLAMQQMQQQQHHPQQQQQQHAQQQQRMQQQSQMHSQINDLARRMFQQLITDAATKFGGQDNIPAEAVAQYKSQAVQRATQMIQMHRQKATQQQQQQILLQQQQAAQQQAAQQQQAAAMQGMGGMM